MAERVLVIARPDQSTGVAAAVRAAAGFARPTGGVVRIAHIEPIPRPRRDRCDRIVVDTDREMARITSTTLARLAALCSEFADVRVEPVVRFGALRRELRIEAGVFAADLVALAGPPRPTLGDHALAWYLARVALPADVPLVLLPQTAGRARNRLRKSLSFATRS